MSFTNDFPIHRILEMVKLFENFVLIRQLLMKLSSPPNCIFPLIALMPYWYERNLCQEIGIDRGISTILNENTRENHWMSAKVISKSVSFAF